MRMIAKFPGLADEQWLDCSEARGTIALFGKEVKVSNRPQAYVRFVSPAGGREHVGLVALTMDQSRTMPARWGDLAHLRAQERSRDRRSRLLIVARGSRVAL